MTDINEINELLSEDYKVILTIKENDESEIKEMTLKEFNTQFEAFLKEIPQISEMLDAEGHGLSYFDIIYHYHPFEHVYNYRKLVDRYFMIMEAEADAYLYEEMYNMGDERYE